MTINIAPYREYAHENGLEIYQVPGGVGVRFSDGYDVYWVLPEERWHFLSRAKFSDDTSYFDSLNKRRELVVDAIRRYMAKQKVAIQRKPNGDWWCMRGAMSYEFSVGPSLTRTLTRESDLVAAMQKAFEGSYLRGPSEERAERHLKEFGKALEEVPWSEEEDAIISIPETPLVALGWMGLCKAIKSESSFESPEAFVAAAEPKGRIGRALLQVAQRLPNTKAAVELCDGSMCIEYTDDYDAFKIAPKSRELRELLHAMEPEQAGDRLADEYERLNSARSRVLNAVFETLDQHGYCMDPSESVYLGRDVREFVLELDERLTNTIQESGEEAAVRQLLKEKDGLADEAVSRLGQTKCDIQLKERPLPPTVPASITLPELTEEQLTRIDERSGQLLKVFIESEGALSAYRNTLIWDENLDTWASEVEWLGLARKFASGKYPRMDAELISFELGDDSDRLRIIERMRTAEPHHECMDEEVELMWQLRGEMPHEAEKWFGPQQYDEVPFAAVRARLNDPIAICHLLGGIPDDEEDEVVPHVLANISSDYLHCFVSDSRIRKWQTTAEEWAKRNWKWNWGGEAEVLAVSGKQGWLDAFEAIEHNPFLLPCLFDNTEDDPGILFANDLLLAWSKYAPSTYLMKLTGMALRTDLHVIDDRLALHKLGKQGDFFATRPELLKQVTDAWSGTLGVALAISWHRCRKKLPTNE